MINGAMEKLNREQFIIRESWRKTRDRLQKENPTAKIKYSYKTKQFRIEFGLPSDLMNWRITDIKLEDVNIISQLPTRRNKQKKMKQKTINEVASMGGKARAKKYSKEQLSKWAKKGGRPKKKLSTTTVDR